MTDVLFATKIECVGEYLYFLTEEESIFGRIEITTGKIKYFNNISSKIQGYPLHNALLTTFNGNVYIISNEGQTVIEFNTKTLDFTEIIDNYSEKRVVRKDWAGAVEYKNVLYLFSREGGLVNAYDFNAKIISYCNTGIGEKVAWICGSGESVYLLSWDCKTMYYYNLRNGNLEAYKTNICELTEIKTKSRIPVHSINCDSEAVYILDAQNVFRFDINNKKTSLLYRTQTDDNGNRLIIIEKNIVIPPYKNDSFNIINKYSGMLQNVKKFPHDIEFEKPWKGSKTGVPCENGKYIFISMINTNRVLTIEKKTLNFCWITLCFEENDIGNLVKSIIRKSNVIAESSMISIERYLDCLVSKD